MELKDAVTFFESYNLMLLFVGIAILGASVLPRILSKYPLSMPIVLVASGYLLYLLPIDIVVPDYKMHGGYFEHITELAVIIAIMGAGLKINRKMTFKTWSITWRLLAITMSLTIATAAFLGWYFAAFVPATALLLGAVIAPTDPVLASEIEEEGPGETVETRSELKFALTSEAGLNDGLAFPFTHLAIAIAFYGVAPSQWLGSWLAVNVFYELIIGIAVGVGLGYILAHYILNLPAKSIFAKSIIGMGALAATLIIYGFTESLGGYGFIAVFFGAITIRQFEPNHDFQIAMHTFIEKIQLVITALILLALGVAIGGGILNHLDFTLVIIALLLVVVVRPLCGLIGLAGHTSVRFKERLAISFLGIRGFGSIYYLAYAVNHQDFIGSDRLWSLVVLVIIMSIFLHGVTAAPILKYLKSE